MRAPCSTRVVSPALSGKHDPAARPTYEPAGFINGAGATVDVYVVGRDCETRLATLQPAEQVHFASWAGQSFRVRRADDTQLLLQQTLGEVAIEECKRRIGYVEDAKDEM